MLYISAETTMSDLHLPAEMLDHVVDHLHHAPDALRNCCLVSKSWVPRIRKHLFADIRFQTTENLRLWKETFPDPSMSPARYAKTLSVGCLRVAAGAGAGVDVEEGGWIRGFSRVVQLEVVLRPVRYLGPGEPAISLVPFHGLSPVIKSLRMVIPVLPSSHLFDLILSFPLLEDLTVIIHLPWTADGGGSEGDEMLTATQLSNPPMFTGSLELYLRGGMRPIIRQLLSLPGGIHFRKLTLTLFGGEDLLTLRALVEECSHTLESLDITWGYLSESVQHLPPHR
jgi:hypothetical protein